MSAQLLASALATMLVLVPRLAGNGSEASDAAPVAPEVAPGEDARMRTAERTPSPPPSHVTVAAEGAPGGQALLVSAPLQIAHAGNVPHNVPPPSRSSRAQHTSGLFPSIEPSQTSQFFGTSSFNSKSKSIQASNALPASIHINMKRPVSTGTCITREL